VSNPSTAIGEHGQLSGPDRQRRELELRSALGAALINSKGVTTEARLNNPHFGCGLAQCGACTIHVDGVPTRSCSLPVSAAAGNQRGPLKHLLDSRALMPANQRRPRSRVSSPTVRLDQIRRRYSGQTRPMPCIRCLNQCTRSSSTMSSGPTSSGQASGRSGSGWDCQGGGDVDLHAIGVGHLLGAEPAFGGQPGIALTGARGTGAVIPDNGAFRCIR